MLAGGAARRFGSDKLAAPIDRIPLLDRAIAGVPADWTLILVGPDRSVRRPAQVVREDPPGGGPAAALVAGTAAAVGIGARTVVAFPGDAPAGGRAATVLVERLRAPDADPGQEPAVDAVVAIDGDGVDQPLHLAVTGAALRRLAARTGVAQLSARALLADLGTVVRLELPAALVTDIDTPGDLRNLMDRTGDAESG